MASKMSSSVFSHRTFCIVTGASRGFGRCAAQTFASNFPANSVLLVIARNEVDLLETKRLIEAESSNMITVRAVAIDLCVQSTQSLDTIIKETFQELGIKAEDFEQAMIVHNAASLGDVSKNVSEIDDWNMVESYFNLNLTSVTVLNSLFLSHFPRKLVSRRVVLNISSICALQPFKSWSLYCAGKAARDMLFRTMALEESDIRVLNYAPGPLDTGMQLEARTKTGDRDIRKLFEDMHMEKKLLSCNESMAKLCTVLNKNQFDSGDHIDYYDLV